MSVNPDDIRSRDEREDDQRRAKYAANLVMAGLVILVTILVYAVVAS